MSVANNATNSQIFRGCLGYVPPKHDNCTAMDCLTCERFHAAAVEWQFTPRFLRVLLDGNPCPPNMVRVLGIKIGNLSIYDGGDKPESYVFDASEFATGKRLPASFRDMSSETLYDMPTVKRTVALQVIVSPLPNTITNNSYEVEFVFSEEPS
jgi:hypothetical protein